MFQIGTGEAVFRNLADAAVFHIRAEDGRQYRTDLRFTLAAVAFNHHHALPLVGGNQAIADKLLQSWNVLGIMQDMSFLLAEGSEVLPDETQNAIIICALLHDLGKMGDYGKPNYVPNMIKSRKKDENGEYPLVQSEAKPYEINKELLYIPHEVRSIAIALTISRSSSKTNIHSLMLYLLLLKAYVYLIRGFLQKKWDISYRFLTISHRSYYFSPFLLFISCYMKKGYRT